MLSDVAWDDASEGRSRKRWPFRGLFVIGESLGVVACVVAVVVYEQNHSGVALWLAFCFGVGTVLNGGVMLLGRTMAARFHSSGVGVSGALTGRTIPARDPNLWSAAASPEGGWRWTGGASVPHWMGRLNASIGLAVLDLDPQGLTFRVRLGRMLGVEPLQATPSATVVCFPVGGSLGRHGVAIQLPGDRPWYFWTKATSEILSTLGWAGFSVYWEERKPQWW